MTDDTPISREDSGAPAEAAPRVRRISNPRPKKTAKAAPKKDEAVVSTAASFPVFDSPAPTPARESEESSSAGDWPEPEAATSGASAPSENAKRKRRRKKGKGGNQSQNATTPGDSEFATQSSDEPAESAQQHSQNQPQRPSQQPQRPRLDSELLAKFAWKIFLSEVSEEGVALVGDNDAKDLSRRCFRLAEIFLEEQARRR